MTFKKTCDKTGKIKKDTKSVTLEKKTRKYHVVLIFISVYSKDLFRSLKNCERTLPHAISAHFFLFVFLPKAFEDICLSPNNRLSENNKP
jgi:hypothetical protein